MDVLLSLRTNISLRRDTSFGSDTNGALHARSSADKPTPLPGSALMPPLLSAPNDTGRWPGYLLDASLCAGSSVWDDMGATTPATIPIVETNVVRKTAMRRRLPLRAWVLSRLVVLGYRPGCRWRRDPILLLLPRAKAVRLGEHFDRRLRLRESGNRRGRSRRRCLPLPTDRAILPTGLAIFPTDVTTESRPGCSRRRCLPLPTTYMANPTVWRSGPLAKRKTSSRIACWPSGTSSRFFSWRRCIR